MRGRDVYFARLAIPRWPANGTRLHTQRSHGNFQRKCRSPRLAELLLATPSVAAITRPHLRLLLHQIAWKTFKDCKRRCGTKSWICIHNMAEAAPLAGEPPQYTALVDCRRRWEVRLGAGALDPRLIPADQSQPATAPSEQAEKAVHWHYCTRHWASSSAEGIVSGSPALINHRCHPAHRWKHLTHPTQGRCSPRGLLGRDEINKEKKFASNIWLKGLCMYNARIADCPVMSFVFVC